MALVGCFKQGRQVDCTEWWKELEVSPTAGPNGQRLENPLGLQVQQALRSLPLRERKALWGKGAARLLARKPIRPTGPAGITVDFNGSVEPPHCQTGSFLRSLREERGTGFRQEPRTLQGIAVLAVGR